MKNPFKRSSKPESTDATMSLMEHLAELRSRLIKCVVAVVVCAIVVYFFNNQIYNFATKPYCDAISGTNQTNCDLVFLGLLEGFGLRLKIATYLGIFFASPIILWQIWRFIAPGLYKKERRYAVAFVASSTALFALGAVIAYYSLAAMFQWLIQNGGGGVYQNRAEDYFSLLAIMILAFGIGFEYPLLLVVLQIVGLVTPSKLAQYRRHSMVGVVAIVAVVTPGGDPISLAALSIPMIVFYEISIWIGRAIVRRRA